MRLMGHHKEQLVQAVTSDFADVCTLQGTALAMVTPVLQELNKCGVDTPNTGSVAAIGSYST